MEFTTVLWYSESILNQLMGVLLTKVKPQIQENSV